MLVSDIPKVMAILKKEYARLRTPAVTEVAEELRASPFRVLVSCYIPIDKM